MSEDQLKVERQLIHLLLNNKDLVSDWIDSPIRIEHFHSEYKLILTAIIESFEKDVLLTRKTFYVFISKISLPKERISQEMIFNSCLASKCNKNDFPTLLDSISESFLSRNSVECISKYSQERDKVGNRIALKDLNNRLQDLLSESLTSKNIIYEDIRDYTPVFRQYLEDVRSGKIEVAEKIICGIKEIDDTMVTGYLSGTLTLFCGDVGAFKCETGDTIIPFANGGRKTIEELYAAQQRGEEIPQLISLNDDKKLIKQTLLKVLNKGIMPCVEIKTSRGFSIKNTLKHKHLLLCGYKSTENIKIGDNLAISRHQYFGEKKPPEGIATWLGCMISDGGTSGIGYCFTNFDDIIVKRLKQVTKLMGGSLKQKGYIKGNLLPGEFYMNSTRKYGKQFGIDGKTALKKEVPEEVFTWEKENIIEFLKAMYGYDGSIAKRKSKKGKNITYSYIIQYHTSSYALAIGVRDLLIKFGIIANIFSYFSSYKKNGIKIEKGITYRVMIQDARQMEKFINEIGFLGSKQKKAEKYLKYLSLIKDNPNNDVIPEDIWFILDKKFEQYGKSFYGCRRYLRNDGKKGKGYEGHCGNRGKAISRELLNKIAEYLNNDKELLSIANSDIYWDKIISIENIGEQQVYDISMPNNHNFVANNIVTHNSTIMLNVGLNIWKMGHNVLFVPIEMAREQMHIRALSRESKVLSEKIFNPTTLTKEDLGKIDQASKNWDAHKGKFFVLQMPDGTTVSAIKRQIEKYIDIFKPKVVIIDYVANLEVEHRRGDRNDLEIGEMLNKLRQTGKTMKFAVISAAQIGREALKRIRKAGVTKDVTAINSEDIRGAHDYSMYADNIYAQLIHKSQPDSLLDIYVVKARNGKKFFSGGKLKATLSITPEIGLIESCEDYKYEDNGEMDEMFEKKDDDSMFKDDEEDKVSDETFDDLF